MKIALWSATAALSALVAIVIWIVESTPDGNKIKSCLRTSLYGVWLCDSSSNYVPLGQVSPYLRQLVLISEDASFYSHSGFDWTELQNSLDRNLESGRIVRGGSTITQQLAKNVFLSQDRTFLRKIREALLTVQIEAALTKDKILEKYLNVIEFGPNIYGVKAASDFYFHKLPRDLNLLEAAYLTFLIPNPKVYSRTFAKKTLTAYSRFRVLDLCYRMFQVKRITELEYISAKTLVDQFPWVEPMSMPIVPLPDAPIEKAQAAPPAQPPSTTEAVVTEPAAQPAPGTERAPPTITAPTGQPSGQNPVTKPAEPPPQEVPPSPDEANPETES
jgi:monofunctional biosynthetic peptidoglycan transglycosylase